MTQDTQELLRLFGRLLRQRGFVQSALWHQRSSDQGGDRGQLRLLRLIADRKQLTNAEIVEALDIRPSSASALVAKLEDAGLVQREPSATDGRVTLISLTKAGQDFIAAAREEKDNLADTLFAGLSAAEQTQLAALLRKLLASLETSDADHASDAYFKQLGPFGPHHGHGHLYHDPRPIWHGPWHSEHRPFDRPQDPRADK